MRARPPHRIASGATASSAAATRPAPCEKARQPRSPPTQAQHRGLDVRQQQAVAVKVARRQQGNAPDQDPLRGAHGQVLVDEKADVAGVQPAEPEAQGGDGQQEPRGLAALAELGASFYREAADMGITS